MHLRDNFLTDSVIIPMDEYYLVSAVICLFAVVRLLI